MKIATLSLLLVTGFVFNSSANTTYSPFGVKNVVLKSFTGSSDGKNVKLTWELADMEHDVTCFIERSEDGIRFTTVATVEIKKGFSGVQNATNTPNEANTYYYRLHMVKSGFIPFTSEIIAIRILDQISSSAQSLSAVHLTDNQMTIKGKFNKGPIEVQVADMNGQTRLVRKFDVNANSEILSFPAENIGKGILIVRVKQKQAGQDVILTKKIVKGDF